jgi:cyanate lyase
VIIFVFKLKKNNMVIKKETPSRNMERWTKQDRKTLKSMTKEGKAIEEIAETLGRTQAAVIYQRGQMGLTKSKAMSLTEALNLVSKKVKTPKGVKVPKREKEKEIPAEMSTRDQAKVMSAAARQIARANGKRITMAMFFVEDL